MWCIINLRQGLQGLRDDFNTLLTQAALEVNKHYTSAYVYKYIKKMHKYN